MLIGLVGGPNKGKSTFFKAATLAEVEIANYPFTTLKSQEGIGFVRVECVDKEFKVKCNPKLGYCINNVRFIPIKILDVPGLIEGSHAGAGMGSQFLTDLNQADILIHIIDIAGTTNEKGELVQPLSYDPIKDIEFLEEELDYWYLGILKKGWEKFARTLQQDNQDIKMALAKQLSALKVTEEIVQDSIKVLKLTHHPIDWTNKDLFNLARELRKRTKPMIIAANKIDIEGSKFNLDRIKEEFKDLTIIPCSADSELALREAAKHGLIEYIPGDSSFKVIGKLNKEQEKALEYIRKNVLEKYNNTGIQQILDKAVFEVLNYIAVFPVANSHLEDKDKRTLPDCLIVPNGITALEFAFKIHTDIGKNFIRAMDLKTKQIIGKEHKLKNRDVIEIIEK